MSDPKAPAADPSDDPPTAISAQAIADRRELAFAAFERTRMSMVVTDPRLPDNPIVMANRSFLTITGYSADEVIGRNCRFMQGPETNAASIRLVHEAIAAEREATVELLNYRRDGTSFWNRLYLSPIRDDDDKLLYYFASQVDVTEERKAKLLESGEQRLLREVDHRAKNALALVQGIVRLTRADDAEAYSRSVQGRVDALAQAHSILSEAHWRDVPLSRLVQTTLAPYGTTRTSFHGPDVLVAAAQVQPLVLLLHELVANAAEHGGLSVAGGTVVVRWHVDHVEIVIDMCEAGGPVPATTRTPGFGLTMADAFVRRQLRGSVAFEWHTHGLETRLVIPMVRQGGDPSAEPARSALR